MRTPSAALIAACVAGAASGASARPVETLDVYAGNEARFGDANEFLYFESLVWLEHGWRSFTQAAHTIYGGVDTLVEPVDGAFGAHRVGLDTDAIFIGYKFRTFIPDWFNFNIRLRFPMATPSDPFDRPACGFNDPQEVTGACTEPRAWTDRLQFRIEPLTFRKNWNTFGVFDRNRATIANARVEYSNLLRLAHVVPDLDFPIATYIGNELRIRSDGRIRDEIIFGIASNLADWLHVGLEYMLHLDSTASESGTFQTQLYVELRYELFINNVARPVRGANEEARD